MRNINDVINENLTYNYESYENKFKTLDKEITNTIIKLVNEYQEDNDEDGYGEHDGIEFEKPISLGYDTNDPFYDDEQYAVMRVFVQDDDDLEIYTYAETEICVNTRLTIYHKLTLLKAVENYLKKYNL